MQHNDVITKINSPYCDDDIWVFMMTIIIHNDFGLMLLRNQIHFNLHEVKYLFCSLSEADRSGEESESGVKK